MGLRANWFESWFDSPYYHKLYLKHNEAEAHAFIDQLAGHFKFMEGMKALDLACGTGRHSRYLAQHGLDVTGIDLSTHNIAEAKKSENDHLHFFVHNMRDVFKENSFDYIFNLFTSFGYFDKDEDQLKTLQSVAKQLKPNGTFVIDFMNIIKVLKQMVPEEDVTVEGVEFHIQRRYDGHRIIKRIQIVDCGQNCAFEERVQGLGLEDFKTLFQKCQMEVKEIFGNYVLSSFDSENSDRLIIVAQKI